MELKVLEQEKNLLKVEIMGEDHTLCNALRKEIWEDKDVKVAGYRIDHALVSSPFIVIETAKKSPKTVLVDAIKRLKKSNADNGKVLDSLVKSF